MDYLTFLKTINNGYDPMLLLGKGGLNYHPKRNIHGSGRNRIWINSDGEETESPSEDEYSDEEESKKEYEDTGKKGPPSDFSELGRTNPSRTEAEFYYSDPGIEKFDHIEYAFDDYESDYESDEEENLIGRIKDFYHKYSDTKEKLKSVREKIEEIQSKIPLSPEGYKEQDKYLYDKYRKEEDKLIEELKKTDEYLEFDPEIQDMYYIFSTQERPEINIDNEDWDILISSNDVLKNAYEGLELGDLSEKIEEISKGKYEKLFDNTGRDFKTKNFEESFENKDIATDFLRQTDKEFSKYYDKKSIDNIQIINTGKGIKNAQGKFEPEIIKYIDYTKKDKKGNYATEEFLTDEYYPVDTIVLVKLKNGEVKKYIIEEKFYNDMKHFSELETQQFLGEYEEYNLTGKTTTYKEICEKQKENYDLYKKIKISELTRLNEEIYIDDQSGKNTDKQIKRRTELLSLLTDNKKMNEDFNKNYHGVYIPMGISKTGHDYEYGKKSEYNKPIAYTLLRKKHYTGQKILGFNKNGEIDKVEKTGFEEIGKKPKENISQHRDYKILLGAKVNYAFSYTDALLGLNWSDKLKADNRLIGNPLYSHHLTRTMYSSTSLKEKDKVIKKGAYGVESKSAGIKPEDPVLIKKMRR